MTRSGIRISRHQRAPLATEGNSGLLGPDGSLIARTLERTLSASDVGRGARHLRARGSFSGRHRTGRRPVTLRRCQRLKSVLPVRCIEKRPPGPTRLRTARGSGSWAGWVPQIPRPRRPRGASSISARATRRSARSEKMRFDLRGVRPSHHPGGFTKSVTRSNPIRGRFGGGIDFSDFFSGAR
jgi:hypothetical protein